MADLIKQEKETANLKTVHLKSYSQKNTNKKLYRVPVIIMECYQVKQYMCPRNLRKKQGASKLFK